MSTLRLRSLAKLFVELHLTENINLDIAIEELFGVYLKHTIFEHVRVL